MAHAILFANLNFRGAHIHVFTAVGNLGVSGLNFSDAVESIVVLEGTWTFFRHPNFSTPYARTLGPGLYPDVAAEGILPNDMTGLRPA